MNTVLLGNIISLFGACLMASIGLFKKRKTILLVQCVQFGIMGTANFVLGGITGGLSAMVSIARNLVCLRHDMTVPIKLLFTLVLTLLCLWSNTAGLLGILPVLSTCLYTWFLDIKGERKLKLILILAQIFWLVYDLALLNYVSFVFDIVTILTNVIGIFMLGKSRSK